MILLRYWTMASTFYQHCNGFLVHSKTPKKFYSKCLKRIYLMRLKVSIRKCLLHFYMFRYGRFHTNGNLHNSENVSSATKNVLLSLMICRYICMYVPRQIPTYVDNLNVSLRCYKALVSCH
jgi:hypothetical protein